MIGMRLEISHETRLTLLQRLQLSCRIEARIAIELKILQRKFNFWKELYRKALRGGSSRHYEKYGLNFVYARVRAKDVPDEVRAKCGWAFSVCVMEGFDILFDTAKQRRSRGEWLLFVIEDMCPDMPERFLEYAAVHEFGEQMTLGDHNLASKLEFVIANKEGDLESYMAWLEERAPGKFSDVFSYQVHLEYPSDADLMELVKRVCDTDDAKNVVRMMKAFKWPPLLLEKLLEYQGANEEIASVIGYAWEGVEAQIASGQTLKEIIEKSEATVRRRFSEIANLRRYMNLPFQERQWLDSRSAAEEKFIAVLHARSSSDPNYFPDVVASGIQDGLPKTGPLAVRLETAIAVLWPP